jgi:hypothetical protein
MGISRMLRLLLLVQAVGFRVVDYEGRSSTQYVHEAFRL